MIKGNDADGEDELRKIIENNFEKIINIDIIIDKKELVRYWI